MANAMAETHYVRDCDKNKRNFEFLHSHPQLTLSEKEILLVVLYQRKKPY